MDAAAESERGIPCVNTRFITSVENEQADAGRDGRTCKLWQTPNNFFETKFSGAKRDRETFIFPVQLTTNRIGNLTRLIYTLLYGRTLHTYRQYSTHTYMHTYIHAVYINIYIHTCAYTSKHTKKNRKG